MRCTGSGSFCQECANWYGLASKFDDALDVPAEWERKVIDKFTVEGVLAIATNVNLGPLLWGEQAFVLELLMIQSLYVRMIGLVKIRSDIFEIMTDASGKDRMVLVPTILRPFFRVKQSGDPDVIASIGEIDFTIGCQMEFKREVLESFKRFFSEIHDLPFEP